jgi:hypothetical protein
MLIFINLIIIIQAILENEWKKTETDYSYYHGIDTQ